MTKELVAIAGWDPSAGAGALLDLRVFERLGHRGRAVITAVTAQSPEKVSGVFPLPARAVLGQFESLTAHLDIGGVKVGMLATAANVKAAARLLKACAPRPRVIDPVLRSSSGALLLERKAWPRFLESFAGQASLITPNLAEAAVFAGCPVRNVPEMRAAAERIHKRSGLPCLVKGGHLEGQAVDILYDGTAFSAFAHPKIGRDVHGTGCYLASAILCYLAEGRPLREACGLGIFRVGRAIRSAVPGGQGVWVFDFNRDRGRVPLPAPGPD